MKHLWMVIVIFFTFVSLGYSQVNLLQNGGFETWTSGMPDNWEFRTPGAHIQATQESGTVHGGSFSCRIFFTTQTQNETDFTNMTPQVSPGQMYTYKAWVFDNDPAGRVRLVIAWFDAQQQFLSTDYSGTYSVDSSGWQQLTFEKEAPPNAAYGGARFRFYDVSGNWDGDCEIFLDDAQFLGPGQNAPTITNVLAQPFPANQPIEITAEVTVSTGSIDSVQLNYYTGLDQNTLDSTLMTPSGGDQYSTTIGALPNATSLIYWVKAFGNGQMSSSGENKVMTGIPDISIFHFQLDGDGLPLHLDHLVRLRGIVTVSTGVFATDRYDFYIQDNTGGINVFSFDPPTPSYTAGDSLEVVGAIGHFNGKVEILDFQATLLSSGHPLPAPVDVNIEDMGEPYEGLLFQIDNVQPAAGSDPWPTTPSTVNMTITDGTANLTMRIIDSTYIGGNPEPNWPVTVVGIGSQYDTSPPYYEGFQIQPRSYADFTVTDISRSGQVVNRYRLGQNYPNPFNPRTTIEYQLKKTGKVVFRVFNILGQEVYGFTARQQAGLHEVTFDGSSLTSGIYFYQLKAGEFSAMRKMVLLR